MNFTSNGTFYFKTDSLILVHGHLNVIYASSNTASHSLYAILNVGQSKESVSSTEFFLKDLSFIFNIITAVGKTTWLPNSSYNFFKIFRFYGP